MNNLNNLLLEMVNQYNEVSKLVALNCIHKKAGSCDEGTIQWNRGCLYTCEKYLKKFASAAGATRTWECRDHEFHAGDYHTTLAYETVRVESLAAQ